MTILCYKYVEHVLWENLLENDKYNIVIRIQTSQRFLSFLSQMTMV
jgi:hypothetical protein